MWSNVRVEFSLSNALFCRARGSFTLDNALLDRVEARMRELVRPGAAHRKAVRGH